jgi:hypothetical protein
MNQTQLTDADDARRGAFCQPNGKFDSGGLYILLKSRDGTPVPAAAFVWDSCAQQRVQLFTWLFVQGRIQSRSNLLRNKIMGNASSICEVCNQEEETAKHVVMGCPFAKNSNRLFYSHSLLW